MIPSEARSYHPPARTAVTPRHKISPQALGDWDAATKSRALYVANWEGDAILEYGVGLDDSITYRKVFAADARLRHPEGIVFWKGSLRVCASYHSSIISLRPDGRVDDSRTVRLRTTDWCWGLAVDPATDRLLVSSSPPYDFQADLPGENPHVARRGAVLEIAEVKELKRYRHAVRVKCPGLTRPGGLAVSPERHPRAGQVFVTEYGADGRSGRVLALDGDRMEVYLDFTDVPCHEHTPPDLVNPWILAFGPSGDFLYVGTDPNHRSIVTFDYTGELVNARRCVEEAPNYLLCV